LAWPAVNEHRSASVCTRQLAPTISIMGLACAMVMIVTLATAMVMALAFTRRPAPIGLPARSLITSRHAVSGDIEDSRKAAKRAYDAMWYRENKVSIL
jgi:hypothetical protein